MPYRPKRPCSFPGCPHLTAGRYCEIHQKQTMAHYNQYQRDPDSNKRYGRRWKKIRAAYLAEHPLCEDCKQRGQIVPAVEVHHKTPLARGGTNETENLKALCTPCHSATSAREGDRWGNTHR